MAVEQSGEENHQVCKNFIFIEIRFSANRASSQDEASSPKQVVVLVLEG
jgi:hypothetical protein